MAKGLKIEVKIDKKARDFFTREMPGKLVQARENAVEAGGKVWADEAKRITRDDGHIVTGLYVNSIGYVTGEPATESDVVHELSESGSKTSLATGSAVAYASVLEKRYNIMARALDQSEERIQKVAAAQVEKTLFG